MNGVANYGGSSGAKSNFINAYKHSISEGKMDFKLIDECCEGYEKLKSLLITFEIPGGIQNVRNNLK